MIQVDELSFDGGQVFCAYAQNESLPANGGLRVMQYPSEKDAKMEAIGLAARMIQKHANYRTGFSGGKIVASLRERNPRTMKALIEVVGNYLNERQGDFLTGCDLNFGDREVVQLSKKSRYILAALDSEVHYAEATAAGVVGAVKACVKRKGIRAPRVIIHGCGAVGSRCAQRLAPHMQVSTYDLFPEKAALSGCINISEEQDWIDQPCDVLIMVSASRVIDQATLNRFRGDAIVSGANLPFADEATEAFADRQFLLIDEGVASAGAVIADSIEYYAREKWQSTPPQAIYDFIEQHIFELSFGKKKLAAEQKFIGQLI